jgi:hypothetical protein
MPLSTNTTQEAVMGKAIPTQHPAVVLRSHYRQLRALLAIATIAVLGLSAAVVILATNEDRDTGAGSATQFSTPGPTGSTRYDGGPEEGSANIAASRPPLTERHAFPGLAEQAGQSDSAFGTRYDGGPEEGTRGMPSSNASSTTAAGVRVDGGPEEGSRGLGR